MAVTHSDRLKGATMRTIRLCDHGILPNTDITLALRELFLQYPADTEFVFEDADYFFSPHPEMRADYSLSNTDRIPYRVLGVWMKHMKNCILTGNGARLWFEGEMQCFTLDRCEDIRLSGFTLNWEKPLVAEGVVVGRDGETLLVSIDPEKYPHRFRDGTLEFDGGAGEWYPFWCNTIAFEPHGRTVRRNTADIWFSEVLPAGDNVYAMTPHRPTCVEAGDLVNLRHSPRTHANIFTEKCRNVVVEDMTVLSGGGLGCLAQFCRDLTYRRVHFLTDTAAGRLVSGGHDDGMHLTCNSGLITVTECTFHALMDDPINVHGCSVTCDEVVDGRTLRCRFRHPQACGFLYWAEAGDTVAFIARGAMNRMGTATVSSYHLEDDEHFLLTLAEPLPSDILDAARAGNALALDNLSNSADFICTGNRFGSCRARGVLVSTAGKVRISENYFESSGSAILVAGDANGWFESGECRDVEITGNVFTDACLSSPGYQFCHGVISICPIVPAPELDKPFHKNIRITDNIFDCAGVPVLYAFSCEGLSFTDNRIFASPSVDGSADAGRIRLQYCRGVRIGQNRWVGNLAAGGEITADCCEDIQKT